MFGEGKCLWLVSKWREIKRNNTCLREHSFREVYNTAQAHSTAGAFIAKNVFLPPSRLKHPILSRHWEYQDDLAIKKIAFSDL